MSRITPEQVKEAYEISGLRPASCFFSPTDGSCCAVGVLVHVKAPGTKIESSTHAAAILGLEPDYVSSFVAAFDYGFTHKAELQGLPGHKDGFAAAMAVRPQ